MEEKHKKNEADGWLPAKRSRGFPCNNKQNKPLKSNWHHVRKGDNENNEGIKKSCQQKMQFTVKMN